MLGGAWGVGELVVLVVAGDEVLHHAAGLEDADRLAWVGWVDICDGRDAAVRVDGEEWGLLLFILLGADLVDLVREPGGVSTGQSRGIESQSPKLLQ